ncbi:MAG TPA: hypothetical protein VFR47_23650 [Anaerolineales bacterium]|nr:hypothetical protein [Anaerolineales bacterium]
MKIRLLPLILLLMTACTFQVDVLDTPVPPQPTSMAIDPSPVSPTSIISQDVSATPPSTPTVGAANTATNTSLPAPVANPGVSVSPIQFGPNGTYVDVLDSITAGESKTYSVRAMKGQVMSISFHQNDESEWTLITMQIVGADNELLCANDCEFWRGVLPATEEYFVTVTPAADALNFVMRVAINPAGAATQSFLYENKYRNASLSYHDMFAPAFFPSAPVSKIQPELVLQFIDTQSYANTNLFEAYFLFGSSTDAQIASTCTQPASLGGPETVLGDVTINGVSFTKSEGIGVGAGNIYEQTYYRTAHNGTCYEITYFIHYGNIGNYDPGTIKEFDQTALIQKFDQILSNLVLE